MGKNNISIFSKCANCGSCQHACPVHAITIDETGLFYMPQVNSDACIDCGKCVSVCPVNLPQVTQNLSAAYGGFHLDKIVVNQSSSGGAFHAFAKKVLAENGVVFGAAFDETHKAVVFSNTDETTLEALQKSKYVESLVGDSFAKVLEHLKNNRKVLFCGTPCQVAGLKRFLGKDDSNLYTCDFSCGGLPSHQLFRNYVMNHEANAGARVKTIDFRPKTYGWKTHAIRVGFENGKVYSKPAELDPFFCGFLHKRVTMRDYCYTCDFSDNHASDIILADFWLHDQCSNLDDSDRGLSLLIVNSEKGAAMIEGIRDRFYLEPLNLEKASYNICNGHKPETLRLAQKEFMCCFSANGYEKAIKQYLNPEFKTILKQWIKQGVNVLRGNK